MRFSDFRFVLLLIFGLLSVFSLVNLFNLILGCFVEYCWGD